MGCCAYRTPFERTIVLAISAGITLLVVGLSTHALGQQANEDSQRLCPLITPELARGIAQAIKGTDKCDVVCTGCGCKGGPGYRDKSDHCVGWNELIKTCGPPPHARCQAECTPVEPECLGRAWVKDVGAKLKLNVKFIEGREIKKKSLPKERSTATLDGDAAQIEPAPQGANFLCAGKRTCKQMDSCDEAKFYLAKCGVKSLDGDRDGVPCNSLCRGR